MADECAAKVAGPEAYAEALLLQGRLTLAWQQLETEVLTNLASEELPDNLPLLLARPLITEELPQLRPEKRTHWVSSAPPDVERAKEVKKWRFKAQWPSVEQETDATTEFNNFHELARRATLFYYQNDLHQNVAQLRFLTVEETIYGRRCNSEVMESPQRYFRGLAHPERACCGIVESTLATGESEALKMELLDCREYISLHNHRVVGLLSEWSKTWRMVRELEAALAQKKAGLHVYKHQFAAFTVGELQDEMERWRVTSNRPPGALFVWGPASRTRFAPYAGSSSNARARRRRGGASKPSCS
jgi:hypothetical protein